MLYYVDAVAASGGEPIAKYLPEVSTDYDGLIATAYWNNTYIEAFQHSSLPIMGVQWHPERMCASQKRPDTVDGSKIFDWFVNLCKKA